MAKTYDEKIAEAKQRIEQEQNRIKQITQQQKQKERKERTKRLCTRMGLFESMLPDTIPLTEEQFKIFLEKTITTEHSRRILDGLTAQNAQTTMPETTTTAPSNTAANGENQQNGTRVLE